ncbi:DUF2746 domain-containing protein [Cryobacterium sp. Hh11]|nr:DUF2746 domain-containing protein [Cryobacterium sp. Hh11]
MPMPAEVSESGQLILGLLTLLGLVVTGGFGFLSVRATQTRNHARAAEGNSAIAREQVQNSHKTNFRDDTDANHAEVLGILKSHGAQLSGMQRDVGRLADADLEHTRQARDDRKRLTDHIDRALTEAVATVPKETP